MKSGSTTHAARGGETQFSILYCTVWRKQNKKIFKFFVLSYPLSCYTWALSSCSWKHLSASVLLPRDMWTAPRLPWARHSPPRSPISCRIDSSCSTNKLFIKKLKAAATKNIKLIQNNTKPNKPLLKQTVKHQS